MPLAKADHPVFTFEPIAVTCSDEGVTTWQAAKKSDRRFLFQVQDTEHYQAAMTTALGALLTPQ